MSEFDMEKYYEETALVAQERIFSQEKWDNRFIELATLISTWSKDTTKVGCVVVGPDREIRSVGYNGFPRGLKETPERTERPEKYLWTEHAERNAIYNAVRMGVSLKGCTLYCSWTPCMDCGRAIIQSGIYAVVGKQRGDDGKWGEELTKTVKMFDEAFVEFRLML